MNHTTRLTTLDLPALMAQISRASIGFDSMFNRLNDTVSGLPQVTNYPPHDIIKLSDTKYSIEVAAAGFKEDELSVALDNNVLTIEGQKVTESDRDYIYHGISNRSFKKVLTLAEHVVVNEAKFENGMLTVNVEIVIPEELKPRKIAINGSNTVQLTQ
jgi:molecular chaperone IbpA